MQGRGTNPTTPADSLSRPKQGAQDYGHLSQIGCQNLYAGRGLKTAERTQRLLREAGFPLRVDEEFPCQTTQQGSLRIQACSQANTVRSYPRKSGYKQTEALKKQFEEAVDQLAAVSGKIELENAHAQVKEDQCAETAASRVTSLLKKAGVTLSVAWTRGGVVGSLAARALQKPEQFCKTRDMRNRRGPDTCCE